jgi:seryl-tRNA synthetase
MPRLPSALRARRACVCAPASACAAARRPLSSSSAAGAPPPPPGASASGLDLKLVREHAAFLDANARLRRAASASASSAPASGAASGAVAAAHVAFGAAQARADELRRARKGLAARFAPGGGVGGGDGGGGGGGGSGGGVGGGGQAGVARPDAAVEEGRRLKALLAAAEQAQDAARRRLEAAARALPAVSHPDAPVGPESAAVEIMRVGEPQLPPEKRGASLLLSPSLPSPLASAAAVAGAAFSAGSGGGFRLRDHLELCHLLQLADFSRTAAGVAGAGFATLLNDGVELELALVQWALSRLRAEGFTLAAPPDLAFTSLVEACGFNPRSGEGDGEGGGEGDSASGIDSGSGSGGDGGGGDGSKCAASSSPLRDGGLSSAAASQVYSLRGSPLSLVGTGEVPLAGLLAGELLPGRAALPRLLAAVTHCFRREAGGGGAAAAGLFRLHQFTKVEMFCFAAPHAAAQGEADLAEARARLARVREPALAAALADNARGARARAAAARGLPAPFAPHAASDALLAWLVDVQVRLVRELGLRCRVLDMPTEELGASAQRKVDVEAWMPGRRGGGAEARGAWRGAWGEVSSASLCGDFQARRLGVRFRDEAGAAGAPRFAHTLNATGLAVPRIIIALLETHQRADGSVLLPECLAPFMPGGKRLLQPPPAVGAAGTF